MIETITYRPTVCAHHWRREGGCRMCVRDHDVAPYLEDGNHRAMQPHAHYYCTQCALWVHPLWVQPPPAQETP